MTTRLYAASALACFAMLAACGGGGGDVDAPDETSPTPADAVAAAAKVGAVKTLDEARRAGSLMLNGLLPSSVTTSSQSASRKVATRGEPEPSRAGSGAPAKAVENCAGGGTITDSQQSNVDVDSPYTNLPFNLTVLTYDLCKETDQDDTQTLNIGTHGIQLSGLLTEGDNDVAYAQAGVSTTQPLRISTQHQSKAGVTPSFAYTVNSETHGVYHYRYGSDDVQTQRFSNFVGSLSGTEGGSQIDAAFVVRRGVSAGNRFSRSFASEGSVYQGSISSALLSLPASRTSACGSGGTFTMTTVAPLDDIDPSEGQLITGTVRLAAGGQTATYVFSGDGLVEITAGDGSKTTIGQDRLINDCPIMILYR